jgi:hypothetical protein
MSSNLTSGASAARALPRRVRDQAAALIAVASVGGWFAFFLSRYPAGDAIGYLAAGERLNVGHALYALAAGDRPIPVDPPFFTSPFLYPPAFAVPWRALAALPSMAGLAMWMGVVLFAMVGWLALQLVEGRMGTALLMAALGYPLALTAVTGNINGLLMVAFALVWQIRGREVLVGGLVGTLTAWKIFPGVLLIWLIATRRWRAAAWAVALLCAWGVIGLIAAGPSSTWTYLTQVVPGTQAMGISLAFLFAWAPLTFVLLGAGTVAVVGLGTRRPRAAYVTALLTAILAWPSLGPASLAMLMAVPAVMREDVLIR